MRAIIIGCYAEGLGQEWLGREIDMEAVRELRLLREKYGISVMGEGGEYESLTIDSPLHSAPLEILSSEVQWSRGSGTMKVTSARLRPGPSA